MSASDGPLAEWEEMASSLRAEIFRWRETDCEARQDAEKSRNRAEAERNAAQEVRKEALLALVGEQAKRAAMEQQQEQLAVEKQQLEQQLQSEQEHSEELTVHIAHLTAELEQQKEVATRVPVLEQHLRAANEAYQRATAQNSMLEQHCIEVQTEADAAAEEARRALASARREYALQQGLTLKAELAITEANKEVVAVQEALSAALVQQQLMGDKLEAEMQVAKRIEDQNAELQRKIRELKAEFEAKETDIREEADTRVQALEDSLANMRMALAAAHAGKDDMECKLEEEKASAQLLSEALNEAEQSQQEVRVAWHRAENALHEMSRYRNEADRSKRELVERLVRERAARILAQQELEHHAKDREAGEGMDKGRLALLYEELASEQQALALILEALQELKSTQLQSALQLAGPLTVPPAPGTPKTS